MTETAYEILVAEDEENLREAVKDIIEDSGNSAKLAENGSIALDILCKDGNTFDLLLLDIQMPRMNGLQLIDQLKKQEINIPILIMTGFGDKATLKEIIKRGCDSYIDKPFTPTELTKMIDETIKRFREMEKSRNKELDAMREKNLRISRIVDIYRSKYEHLNQEVKRAIHSYTNLVSIDSKHCNAPIAWRQRQLASLGGDYFGVNNTERGCDLLIADVAGHDMSASYHAVVVKSLFAENEHNKYDGETFMKVLNALILNKGNNERMVTSMFISFDMESHVAEVVSAAHPYLLIIPQSGNDVMMFPEEGSDPIGLKRQIRLRRRSLSVKTGDRALLFSDGLLNVAEITGETGEKKRLSKDSIIDFALRHRNKPLDVMVEGIWAETLLFCRKKISDDMLLVAVEIS